MAIVKAVSSSERTLFDMIYYVLNEEKVVFSHGYGLNPSYAYMEMQFVQDMWHKTDGRQYKQFIISFSEEESNWLELQSFRHIGIAIGEYYGRSWQTLIVGHNNTKHQHYHIIVNSVNPVTGSKFTTSWFDLRCFKLYINEIIQEYGVGVLGLEQFAQ